MGQLKIQVYVDWNNHKILDKADYLQELDREAKGIYGETEEFDEWLEWSDYKPHELLNMTDEEKADLRSQFYDYCTVAATNTLRNSYEEVTISVDNVRGFN